MNNIFEPIFIYAKDTGEVWKFKYISIVENSLEAYDIDNYEAYDSKFRKLILFKKDKFNRVGFKLDSKSIYENELKEYLMKDIGLKDANIDMQELISSIDYKNY